MEMEISRLDLSRQDTRKKGGRFVHCFVCVKKRGVDNIINMGISSSYPKVPPHKECRITLKAPAKTNQNNPIANSPFTPCAEFCLDHPRFQPIRKQAPKNNIS